MRCPVKRDFLLELAVVIFAIAALVACSLIPAAPVHAASGEPGEPAQIVASGYQFDKQTAGLRTTLSTADTITSDALVIALHTPIPVRGRPTISVSAKFSNASATCGVTVFFFYKNGSTYYLKDRPLSVTFTAPAGKFGDTYMAPSQVFDTYGATHVIVALTTATSAGTVDLGYGSF